MMNRELWLFIALAISSMATLIGIVTIFYLFEWRRRLVDAPYLVLPDAHGKHLKEVSSEMAGLSSRLSTHGKRVDDTFETIVTLRNAIEQRDAEIAQLRKGHDTQVFRRFLLRFIRVDKAMRDALATGDHDANTMGLIGRLLEDALEECGLETFSPEVGADSRTTPGIGDSPKIRPTPDAGRSHQIAEVLEPGYRINTGGAPDVIVPAKVAVYVYKES